MWVALIRGRQGVVAIPVNSGKLYIYVAPPPYYITLLLKNKETPSKWINWHCTPLSVPWDKFGTLILIQKLTSILSLLVRFPPPSLGKMTNCIKLEFPPPKNRWLAVWVQFQNGCQQINCSDWWTSLHVYEHGREFPIGVHEHLQNISMSIVCQY